MSESSQAVIRSIALTTLTVLFAGIWGNDRPTHPTLAFLPPDQRTFVIALAGPPARDLLISKAASVASTRELRRSMQPRTIPAMSRTISVESGELAISKGTLSGHLSRLPMGLAIGDYRLVDSLGGVGWLHVRGLSNVVEGSVDDATLTTEVNGDRLSIIRVQSAAASTATRETPIRR